MMMCAVDIQGLIDFVVHIDQHILDLAARYGGWTYTILFAIIFCETGLVVTPFLPGDSLLFATGAVAATGALNVVTLMVLLTAAAIIGDSVNYWIGSALGTRMFKDDARVLKTEYLQRTQTFYKTYGGKTIVIARFVPIVRTYAPFVAGVARMHYPTFLTYNIAGAIAWIVIFLLGGYLFGGLPFVEDNFALVIIVVILLSLLPMFFELWKNRRIRRLAASAAAGRREQASDEA